MGRAPEEVEAASEQLVLHLEAEKDKAVAEFQGLLEGDPDSVSSLMQDADGVMVVVDKLFAASASWFGGAKDKGGAQSDELELQKLQLSKRSPAEQCLAKYSALGKVLAAGVTHAVAALPFSGPVASALGAIFCTAVTVCPSCPPACCCCCVIIIIIRQ